MKKIIINKYLLNGELGLLSSKNIIKMTPTNISLIDESRIDRKYMNNLFLNWL